MLRHGSLTDPHPIEWLATIHAACFTTPRPWKPEEFSSLLARKHVYLVSSEAGFAIGRAVAGEVELLTLAVAPFARRSGHGRALMSLFEKRALEHESTESFLEVAADNTAAVALYESLNYHESGRRKKYYTRPDGTRLDALVLRKQL